MSYREERSRETAAMTALVREVAPAGNPKDGFGLVMFAMLAAGAMLGVIVGQMLLLSGHSLSGHSTSTSSAAPTPCANTMTSIGVAIEVHNIAEEKPCSFDAEMMREWDVHYAVWKAHERPKQMVSP